jgi:hypothetical protein
MYIPTGWISLGKHFTEAGVPRTHRLGIYCSMACVNNQMPRLIGVEASLGDEWINRTEGHRLKKSLDWQ